MNWIITGIILYIVGKIIKSAIVEKIGFWVAIIGVVLMLLGMVGISIPFL